MTRPPLLAVRGLTARLGGQTILDRVDLQVAAGQRLAVTGPNGAGKTTLLDAIAGTRQPTNGRIIMAGCDVTHASAQRRARLGLARLWQQPALCPHLTTMDNLLLALPGHPRWAAGREQAARLLDQAGLAQHVTTPAGRLSYGQQRRLELSIALAARPRLLLLDEPTAGLDPDQVGWLRDRLAGLDPSVAVILTSHDPELVAAIADTVTTLDHGHAMPSPPPAAPATPSMSAAHQPPARGEAGAAALAVRGLSATQHATTVLRDVDLDLCSGEVLAVTGHNGAGKTTMLRAIAGLHPTAPGTSIHLAGRNITGLTPAARARAGLALVPQDRRTLGELTVADQLRLPTRRHHPDVAQWTVEKVLELLPILRPRLPQLAATLSEGERQALALARALLTKPRVLLLDEPFEGLAPTLTDRISAVLTLLAGQGVGILLVDHHTSRLAGQAERILWLDQGNLCPES